MSTLFRMIQYSNSLPHHYTQTLTDHLFTLTSMDTKNPSIITGDNHRPDLLIQTCDCLYILELTVGFESNLQNNIKRKYNKYKNLIDTLQRNFKYIKFVNLSISSLGVFSNECSSFLEMLEDLDFQKKQKVYVTKKIIQIAIRSTYFIFCKRNKVWENPDLMKF